MSTNVLELGEAYFDALNQKDISRISALVDPAIKFKMPLGEYLNRENFLSAVQRMLISSRTVRLKSKFASDNQGMFIYEIQFNDPVGTVKAASLMTVEGDKIKEIEVFFDARPFEKLAGPSSPPAGLKKAA
jgi:hypothetical protein